MIPAFLTFTGADDQTDIAGMIQLGLYYPIEWGILFSASRQGEARYPGRDFVREAARCALYDWDC